MASHLREHYGECEGPLGVPCLDRQARLLDRLLRQLPRDELHAPGHLVVGQRSGVLLPGERADVSWISTEAPDRMREIVRARGMNDEHFRLNPLVTLQHAYWLPPVGRSLWRRVTRQGQQMGIRAKTHYPPRPEGWSSCSDWPPDVAFALVQGGLLSGKSIGFVPTRVRRPTDEECARQPEMRQVQRIIEEWVLLEYACVYLPAQQEAVVQAISKGWAVPSEFRQAMQLEEEQPTNLVGFTPFAEFDKYIYRRLEAINWDRLARECVQQRLNHLRGRI